MIPVAPFVGEFWRVLGVLSLDVHLESELSGNPTLLHTQEVTGSSPVAPTIHFRRYKQREELEGVVVTWIVT